MKNLFLISVAIAFSTTIFFGALGINGIYNFRANLKKIMQESIDYGYNHYSINVDNVNEVNVKDRTYVITEEKVNIGRLDNPIGDVLKTITVDENNKIVSNNWFKIGIFKTSKENNDRYLTYGLVYSIKGEDSKNVIAIELNNSYRLAKLK